MTAGDAQRTRGLTDDTIGFILHAGGSVRIADSVVNQVLVRGTGHFSAACGECIGHSSTTPPDDFWIDVVEIADATSQTGTSGSGIVVTCIDGELQLVDVRTYYPPTGCGGAAK